MADQAPWWAGESFWRKTAAWVTAGMFLVLIVMTFDSLGQMEAGGSRVPAYSVINRNIDYVLDEELGRLVPRIGGSEPLFGETLSEADAAAIVRKGKLVIQSRNCMNCHTLLGNGAYYAPDLTKSWLDSSWGTVDSREHLMLMFLQDPVTYARGFGTGRKMPDLGLSDEEARAVVAYLKWMSAIDTNGFPYGFRVIGRERQQ